MLELDFDFSELSKSNDKMLKAMDPGGEKEIYRHLHELPDDPTPFVDPEWLKEADEKEDPRFVVLIPGDGFYLVDALECMEVMKVASMEKHCLHPCEYSIESANALRHWAYALDEDGEKAHYPFPEGFYPTIHSIYVNGKFHVVHP